VCVWERERDSQDRYGARRGRSRHPKHDGHVVSYTLSTADHPNWHTLASAWRPPALCVCVCVCVSVYVCVCALCASIYVQICVWFSGAVCTLTLFPGNRSPLWLVGATQQYVSTISVIMTLVERSVLWTHLYTIQASVHIIFRVSMNLIKIEKGQDIYLCVCVCVCVLKTVTCHLYSVAVWSLAAVRESFQAEREVELLPSSRVSEENHVNFTSMWLYFEITMLPNIYNIYIYNITIIPYWCCVDIHLNMIVYLATLLYIHIYIYKCIITYYLYKCIITLHFDKCVLFHSLLFITLRFLYIKTASTENII